MSLDPLADYLKPRFGNIYGYNLIVLHGNELQEWTDELRQAIKHYLVHEVSDTDYAAFVGELEYEPPPGTRESQADAIIDLHDAWEIAHAFHQAAVKAIPALDGLIGQRASWQHAGQQEDAAEWLDAHATKEQLAELAEITDHPEYDPATPWYRPEPVGRDFTWTLTPPELLHAWHQVAGPAPTDLTDGEWALLVSVLPRPQNPYGIRQRSDRELLSLRLAFNGVRYKFTHDLSWSKVPRRYGRGANLYQRYRRYKESGDLAEMLNALQGQPEATRLVETIRLLLGDATAPD